MTQDEIDVMWQKALRQSVEANEQFTRYRFADLVAGATKEQCAKVCEELFVKEGDWPGIECRAAFDCAAAIRSMK